MEPGASAAESARALQQERLRFSRITADDFALLEDLRPTFERHAERFVDAFYAHLMTSEILRPLLADPLVVQRLREAQREYMLSLTSGSYDRTYVERRLAIGRVHARIGLAPQWYLGMYSLYHDLLMPEVHAHHAEDPARGARAAAALSKLLILDMQLVLDAYYEVREKRVVERSEQLAAVGEMAASIAHEVRNPLAGMRGALEILQRGRGLAGDAREVLQEVLVQIDRLEGLVRDLLSFASPRPLALRPFDLHELLERMLRTLEEQIAAAGVRLERLFEPGTHRIVADPQQLEQVFLNLLYNALQAMEEGGRLTVRVAAAGAETIVCFEDSGRGIAPDVLPQIFQPFFTTKHRGSGLGLPIVRKIVEAHGGTIAVRSAGGAGTVAELRLPRAEG